MITRSPTSDDLDYALNSPQSPMRRILHVPMMTPEKKLVHVPLMTPDRRPVEVGDMQFSVKSNNQNSYMMHTTPNKSTPIKQLPFSPSQVSRAFNPVYFLCNNFLAGLVFKQPEPFIGGHGAAKAAQSSEHAHVGRRAVQQSVDNSKSYLFAYLTAVRALNAYKIATLARAENAYAFQEAFSWAWETGRCCQMSNCKNLRFSSNGDDFYCAFFFPPAANSRMFGRGYFGHD